MVVADVQDRYRTVADGFDAAVRAGDPDGWDAQSPCDGWKARDVVAHVVTGHRGVISNVMSGQWAPVASDDDPKRAWEEVSREMRRITADAGLMAREIDGPAGKMPAGELISRLVAMDLLVHTWDLARAVGADDRLDEDTVRHAYEVLKPMDTMMRRPGVFGPKLVPPAGADLQEEFLCFLGRA